jgi:hypothetical protein
MLSSFYADPAKMGGIGIPQLPQAGWTPPYAEPSQLPSQPMDQSTAPASTPFQWGAGGTRLTPEQIASQRAADQQQIATGMDFSPVQSWTQGLARVAQALVGSLDSKRLDKATAANAAESAAAAGAIGNGGNGQSVAAILANPYINPGAKEAAKQANQQQQELQRQLAVKQFELDHPAPATPGEFEQRLMASGVQQGTPQWVAANQAAVQNVTDPIVNIPLPGGRVYVGPRSGIMAATGGGDPSSTAGASAPPATLPPDFDFGGGGTAPAAPSPFHP